MEEEDTVLPFMEADENARGAWQRSPFTEAKSDLSDTFLEAAQVNVGERKRRSAEMSLEIDVSVELLTILDDLDWFWIAFPTQNELTSWTHVYSDILVISDRSKSARL